MSVTAMVDNAMIMPKGQITIPKEIRRFLNVVEGDKITFICEGEYAIVMNTNVYAMRMAQNEMANEWEEAGIYDENDILELCREVRAEIEGR